MFPSGLQPSSDDQEKIWQNVSFACSTYQQTILLVKATQGNIAQERAEQDPL